MKRCPTCHYVYMDDTLNFCLEDGARLTVAPDEAPTRLIKTRPQKGSAETDAFQVITRPPPPNVTTGRPSVAVLPFSPLGASGSDEYLGLGMADSLITRLSGINRIIVRPTSSIHKYMNGDHDSVEIGREQRVDSVLEGSIQRAGEKIRVTARLINVHDGSSLWGYQDDEKGNDIFDLQDSITEKIATSLVQNLTREEERQLGKQYTQDQEAFHQYLKGRYYWNRFTEDALEKAIECFKEAVTKDPNYALAYTGLADCYGVLGINYQVPSETFPNAKAAVARALDIDNTLAEAHATLGALQLIYERNLPEAESELKRAIEINSGIPSAYQLYAYYHHVIGRPDVGVALLEKALELDPLSLLLNTDLGWSYLFTRQFDKTLEQGMKTLEIDPNFAMAHLVIGMAYEQKQIHKKAINEMRKALKLSNESPRIMGWLGFSYARSGDRIQAQQIIEKLKKRSKKRHVDPYNIAVVQAGLGNIEAAFESLEKAYDERSGQLIFLGVDPLMDSLRADPRFAGLAGRLGLQAPSGRNLE